MTSLTFVKYTSTVKLVSKDHHRDPQVIHRCPLYAGSVTWKVYPWGPVNCGLYQVGGLYASSL